MNARSLQSITAGWPSRIVAVVSMLTLSGCTGRDVIAKVDGTKLLQADLAAYRAARGRAPREALDALIDRTLLAQAARRSGLAEDASVQARIRAAEREILAQAFLERELATASGDDVLHKRYSDEKEKLSRREIHVALIAVQPRTPDPAGRMAAQSKASHIYARLAGGEPFEKVASELSDDPVSRKRGGDLGTIHEGEVDPKFFEAAAAIKRGEVSKPFESAFGFHVVKALEDPKTVLRPFQEVRGILAAEARTEAEHALLKSVRDRSSVKLYPENLAKLSSAKDNPR